MIYLRIIKNHWKKLAFASIPLTCGVIYLKTNYEISKHMRLVCGDIIHDGKTSNQKRVLVIVNPVAHKRKAENLFRKYCEPILHLAGYTVEIFKTNSVGHAKSFIEELQFLPDAIVVAGGDGTSSEVVTGLMRRKGLTCPIALLPLGTSSETALKYYNYKPTTRLEYVKSLTGSLLPILNDSIRSESVLRFEALNNDETAKGAKPIYGMNRFSWGLLRDIEALKDKYWYFGYFRHHAAAFFKSLSGDNCYNLALNYVYTPPCAGCTNCATQKIQNLSKFNMSKFLSRKPDSFKHHTINEECNVQTKGFIETNQLNIMCNRNDNDVSELETKFITSLTPGFEYFKNISNITKNKIEPSTILKSRTIQLLPEKNFNVNMPSNAFYTIDGEEYDVRPIKVTVEPNAINVFCNKT